MMIHGLELLAQVPSSYQYVHPVKLAAVAAVFAVWALVAQWVDKDAVVVNTYRILWNIVMLFGGALAAALALLIPIFAIGLPAMLVVDGVIIAVYVVHRNGLVKEDERVLTIGHFRRLKEQGLSGKKKVKEVQERVRLTAFNRKVVPIPPEDPEREMYRLTQDLMFNALCRRAAITELAPASSQTARVTYLIDGVPVEGENIPRPEADALVMYVKQIAGLNVEERRKPQKGEIMAAIGDQKRKVVVRTDGSTAGEKLTLRVIGREAELKVADLGFTPKQLELAQATKQEGRGLILLSAPPGCGLTTTVYSFTRNHDRFLQNVQTIEYEKELDVENVTQNIFNPAEGVSFAERLLKLVRSDPDIIVLPEVRERDAATIACKAAAEKQKVYVGLVANDVMDALRKWITMVGDRALVAKSLMAVSNQRLVRVLCPTCKEAYKPDPQTMRRLNLPEDRVLYRPPEPQVDKKGQPIICSTCQGTGYMGRTGVFDWLAVDDGLREAIRRSSTVAEIQSYVAKRGGLGLQAHGLQKVLEGVTSIQELARVLRADGRSPTPRPATARPQPRPQVPRGPGPGQPGR